MTKQKLPELERPDRPSVYYPDDADRNDLFDSIVYVGDCILYLADILKPLVEAKLSIQPPHDGK